MIMEVVADYFKVLRVPAFACFYGLFINAANV
jgi:hypothetical protein